MKITYRWLQEYVDLDWSPSGVAEHLTMLGLEVEGIEETRGQFEGIVVAEVLACNPHPRADRLSVCQVHDGTAERQIVCGATNFKVGDKVPLILPGHTLPAAGGEKPLTIKVGKLRGIDSQGMMCSGKELGLSDDPDGLMILEPDARVGQPFAAYLGVAETDHIYDLEVTPNRPDLNSALGIAREISALSGHPLKLPEVRPSESGIEAATLADVRIEASDLCPRYVARVLRGVTVGPSPDWLRSILDKIGIRSINNIVDVTNFVMMETGQPLHAFDYRLIAQSRTAQGELPTIVVRRASANEPFKTLDGQEHALSEHTLLIADATHGIALAGIMGGEHTEIQPSTRDVLLESAYFNPQNIRATARHLGLHTEASYRFERGADIGIPDWASRRAAELISQLAGGSLARGCVDAYPVPAQAKHIRLRYRKTSELLGVPIPGETQRRLITQLGIKALDRGQEEGTFEIPSFRVDLKCEVDLIEEVIRLYGVEQIPSTAPKAIPGEHSFDLVQDDLSRAREILAGLGLSEAQGQTLISEDSAALVSAHPVPLEHPLSSDMNVLRPSLLPGLMDALHHNLHRKNLEVALFEIGRVFSRDGEGLREQLNLALALHGPRCPAFWRTQGPPALYDLFDLKGCLEDFFDQFGLRDISWQRQKTPQPLYLEAAELKWGRLTLGQSGRVTPLLAKKYDFKHPVLLAELALDPLLKRRKRFSSFKPIPRSPCVRRDIAMLIPEATCHGDVLAVIQKARIDLLQGVELFDVFRGKGISEGHKSVAYAFTYQHPKRTLTDGEVNAVHARLIQSLQKHLDVQIR